MRPRALFLQQYGSSLPCKEMGSAPSSCRLQTRDKPPKDKGYRLDASSKVLRSPKAYMQPDPEVDKPAEETFGSPPLQLQANAAEPQSPSPTPLRRQVHFDAATDPDAEDQTPSPLRQRRSLKYARRRHTAPADIGAYPVVAVRRRIYVSEDDAPRDAIEVAPTAANVETLLGRDFLRRTALINSFVSPPQLRQLDWAADGAKRGADAAEEQWNHDDDDDEREMSGVHCVGGGSKSAPLLRRFPAAGEGGDRPAFAGPATIPRPPPKSMSPRVPPRMPHAMGGMPRAIGGMP